MPNIANKEFIYQQYDHEVGVRTIIKPGHGDAAVLRLLNRGKAIAVKTDCNSFHSYLDPFYGNAGAVAESIRNIIATGSEPVAIADCCNFGNPENPEVFWQFKKSIEGLSYILRGLSIPCIGGNVSFYNEDKRTGIAVKPTIVVVALGLIENLELLTTLGFKEEGEAIIAIGKTFREMGGSHYCIRFKGIGGRVPIVNIVREKSSLDTIQLLIRKGHITAAHDCSKGGLAIALAIMAIRSGFGAKINLERVPKTSMKTDELLFSESHARFIVTARKENVDKVIGLCKENNVNASKIGEVSKDGTICLLYRNKIVANCDLVKMEEYWEEAIPKSAGMISS